MARPHLAPSHRPHRPPAYSTHDQPMRPPQPRHRLHASSTRTPALVIAFSSLLLSAGLATSLFVFNESLKSQLDGDLDQAAVVAWWAGDAALKWALISATGSLCGVVGILIHNSPLHRVFAVSTFADFLLTLFLTFTFSLLTFTPSLAQPFSSFLCSSLMSSEFSSSSAGHLLHERDSTSWPSSGGIDILLWGVEACEDSWRSGLVKVILGCVVAAALRVYGVWVSWEMNAELRDLERRGLGEGWIDTESSNDGERGRDEHRRGHAMDEIKSARSMEESLVTRSRSASATTATATSQRRSNTLPATGLPPRYSDESPRPRSHSASYPPATGASSATPRPRLVLLPVYVDEQGKPIYSPDSPTFPYVHVVVVVCKVRLLASAAPSAIVLLVVVLFGVRPVVTSDPHPALSDFAAGETDGRAALALSARDADRDLVESASRHRFGLVELEPTLQDPQRHGCRPRNA